MKILLVSSYLPFPLYDGGSIRLYNLIKELHTKHEITLICEKRLHQTRADVHELEKICKKVVTVPRKQQWSIQNIVKTGFSSDSFLITGHRLPRMTELIKKELQESSYDLIHIETSYVMQNLPPIDIPTVLVEHNIEYMVYEKFKNKAVLPLRPLLQIDIAKLRKKEQTFWREASQVVAVSDLEKKVIERTGVKAKTVYNGVDLASFAYKDIKQAIKKSPKQFLFIGNYKWLQNRDAARWILQDVWPKVKEKVSTDINLRIVGRDMPEDIRSWSDETVIIEENSPRKTAEIFSESFALLAPIRIGGGSQYKILEAMAVGTPTITTTLGLSGLDVRKDKDILVGDTAAALVDKVVELVNNTQLYETLSENGRKQVEERYDWKKIAQTLEDCYRLVVQQ